MERMAEVEPQRQAQQQLERELRKEKKRLREMEQLSARRAEGDTRLNDDQLEKEAKLEETRQGVALLEAALEQNRAPQLTINEHD